jgi:protein O-mannosyl-transferase
MSGSMKQEKSKLPERSKTAAWVFYAMLCGIVFAAYSNSFGTGLALDAQARLQEDTRLHTMTAENVQLILTKHYWWPQPVDRLYRPVTLLTFLFNYAVLGNGTQGSGYHVLNLLFHLLNVWLVCQLAMRVLHRQWAAWFAAALWAVHPVQTDAVTNIIGRSDELSAAAVFGGVLLYARAIELTGTRRQLCVAALFVVTLLGVFSKENAAVLPGLMVLWDVAFGWKREPGWKPRQAAYGAVAAALCVMLAVRWKIFESEPWRLPALLDNPMFGAGFLTSRLTAIGVLGRYLVVLVWPSALSSDYAYNQIPLVTAGDLWLWAAFAAAAGILFLAIRRYRSDRVIFWAVGFFAIALLPTSNLVVLGASMALRFLYVPSAGFAIAAAALAFRLSRPRVTYAILTIAVMGLAARTFVRNPAWRDNLALGEADTVSAPRSFRTHQMLATALYREDPRRNLDAAIREYEIAAHILESLPLPERCPDCLADLGIFYFTKANDVGGASSADGRAWFGKAAAMLQGARDSAAARKRKFEDTQLAHHLPPLPLNDSRIYLYLARTYKALGRLDDALAVYREAQWENPAVYEVYDEEATLYAMQGKIEQAAVVIVEKSYAVGMTAATQSSLRNLYGHIPDGTCALQEGNGRTELNPDCPRVRADLCVAWAELDAAYRAYYQTLKADALRAAAIGRYGCPATAFGTGQ